MSHEKSVMSRYLFHVVIASVNKNQPAKNVNICDDITLSGRVEHKNFIQFQHVVKMEF